MSTPYAPCTPCTPCTLCTVLHHDYIRTRTWSMYPRPQQFGPCVWTLCVCRAYGVCLWYGMSMKVVYLCYSTLSCCRHCAHRRQNRHQQYTVAHCQCAQLLCEVDLSPPYECQMPVYSAKTNGKLIKLRIVYIQWSVHRHTSKSARWTVRFYVFRTLCEVLSLYQL